MLHGTDPVISGNLIPVTLSENGIVTKASLGSEWYDYETKNWANAVILTDESLNEDYEVGDNIAEMDIESYFVWIPRYRYQIFDTGAYSSNGTIQDAVQTIQVVFENKDTPVSSGTTVGNWLTHPAFTSFDSNGMWVGKFETGYKEAADSYDAEHDVNDSSKVIIKDNVWSWRRINNANAFYTSYNYQRDLDSHMMKNTEWGAVAYLQHSIYGSQASVRINNNSDYVTGYAANSEPTCGYTASLETCNIFCYDDTCNTAYPNSVSASTTGNVTGIFDMSGGAWDNVMGVIVDSSGNPMSGVNASMNSGFKGTYSQGGSNTTGYDWPERKYYDLYAASTTFYGYNNRILGDATGETGPSGAVKHNTRSSLANSWYEDYAYFAFTSGPWFCRGNDLAHGKGSGIFAFNATYGNASENGAFRIVLSPI